MLRVFAQHTDVAVQTGIERIVAAQSAITHASRQ